MSLFLKASRLKLRFPTTRGELTVESLWDLPLTSKSGVSLDGIAIDLHSKLSTGSTISFVDNSAKSQEETLNQLRFDIVKTIIDARVAENKAKLEKQQLNERKAIILEALAEKRKEALTSGSIQELEAELALINAKSA